MRILLGYLLAELPIETADKESGLFYMHVYRLLKWEIKVQILIQAILNQV